MIDRLSKEYFDELSIYDSCVEKEQETCNEPKSEKEKLIVSDEIIARREMISSIKHSLVVVVATYLEGIVNYYLSLKMNAEQFKSIERGSLIDKWSGAIEFVVPNYKLEKGKEAYCSLSELINTRNDLIHYKPRIVEHIVEPPKSSISVLHKGSTLKHLDDSHNSDRRKIERWVKLPNQLLDHLLSYDKSDETQAMVKFSKPFRPHLWKQPEHWGSMINRYL